MTASSRRTLSFGSLDEVMPDVDRLLPVYRGLGNWSLGQVCNHLAATFRGSIEGFPVKAPWIARQTVAQLALKRMLKSGRMPEGVKIPEELGPRPGLDDRAEAEALRATIRLFAAHTGPVADHPFFGPIGRDVWEAIHRIHCAHHLGFIVPEEVPTQGTGG
ncbi:MAG: DUF1569 domain-containing protein [Isosphaeraceae bacterium]